MITALAIMAMTATPSYEATQAIVNMVVAERYCSLNAPKQYVYQIGTSALSESGMTNEEFTEAAYLAADILGPEMVKNGTIGPFCARMAVIYARGK